MNDVIVIRDLEDDPDGVHIVIEHGITQDEVDESQERDRAQRFERASLHLWLDPDRPPPHRHLGPRR